MSLAKAAPAPRSPLERRARFLGAVALLVCLGLAAELRSYAGPDTGFLLDEAARALDGARVYVDLVDLNPPLIVLLNIAAVRVARATDLSAILVYRVGCTAVLLASLLLVAWLLRRLYPQDGVFRRGVVLLLTFVLFNLPGQDFGEREHLVLALVVPYLLVAAGRASGRPIPPAVAVFVGLLAAGAFAIKPPFVLLWGAIEVWLRWARRIAWTTVVLESATIGVSIALYILATHLWSPAYFHLVRLLAGPYTRFLYVPFWELLLGSPAALLTVLAILAFAALGRHARHPEAGGALALGAIVCLSAGALQQKEFSYHFYPSLALAALAVGTIVWDDPSDSPRNLVTALYRVVAMSVLVTAIVLACARNAAAIVRLTRETEHEQLERLLPVVRDHAAGEGVYVMSYNISSAYPLINYAGAHSASRFAQLWILPAAYMDQLRDTLPLRYHAESKMGPSERYLNEAVFEDLRDQRPRLLIILRHARDLPGNGFRRLDYVGYFRRDSRIGAMLDRYQQIADLGDFVVYQRVADGVSRAERPPSVEPGTRDIVQVKAGGLHLTSGDPGGSLTWLAVLAFIISTIAATIVEAHRVSPETARGGRWR